jgi:hypothetical protein
MSDNFEIHSFLICDEVRNEVGGKQIIIGAYAGLMLVPFLPFMGTMLSLRFEVTAYKPTIDHAACTVLRPNGSIFYHHDMPFTVHYPRLPFPIVFMIPVPNFEHEGDYAVLLAMDSSPARVGTFKIVTRENLPQFG